MDPEELLQAKHLKEEGKFIEALKIIKEIEKNEGITSQDQLSNNIIKCTLLNKLGFHEDALKLSKKIYKDVKKLGTPIQIIDVSIEMAEAFMYLERYNDSLEVIMKCEKFFKTITLETTIEHNRIESAIALIKGYINVDNYFEPDLELSLKYLKYGLALQKRLGVKHEIARFYQYIGFNYFSQGDWDLALKYFNKALALEENGFNMFLTWLLFHIGGIYNGRGELDHALNYYKRGLALAEKLNSGKINIAYFLNRIGNIYYSKGDFDQALIFSERGLTLYRQIGHNIPFLASFMNTLLLITISKNEINQAEEYLQQIKEISDQTQNEGVNRLYRVSKALLLKTKPRISNLAKALKLLKEVIEEDAGQKTAIINLCDILLVDLRNTNDLEVLDELNQFIGQLLEIAEKSHSYWILCETYLLQAKLALISLDLKEARRLLTQAQQITEKYGLILLARKISNEHDELLKKLNTWENLKDSDISLAERMELARLNEQMGQMIRKRELELPDLPDEDPIVLLIISEGGRPVFSESFVEEWSFEDHLFGGFLTAVNSFSDEMFSEGLNRANFGEYTIIMNSLHPFLVYYLFKGQSYLAQQRVKKFIDIIKKDKNIWKTFNEFNQTCRVVQLEDIPSLEPLINEIFLEKSIPLN
ncbi:Photosystem I assembly protein Ycf3 [subsurface metagenome]